MLDQNFIARLKNILPADRVDSVIATFTDPSKTAFRINPLKKGKAKTLEELTSLHIQITPVSWNKDTYLINATDKAKLSGSTAFASGFIYIQNLSSMLPVIVLDPQPGEEILDLTAAPGSKTTQIAAMMNNQGRVAAVEKSRKRFFKLKNNITLQGATCVDTYCKDGRLVCKSCPERFDRVLIDAPCSSEARFNINDTESTAYWSEKKIKEMARNQWALLHSAFLSLKPGGTLVYSTCSFAPEENETNIAKLIKKYGEQIQLLDINLPIDNTQPGLTEWNGKAFPPELVKTLRVLPTDMMSGFYIAHLKKQPL